MSEEADEDLLDIWIYFVQQATRPVADRKIRAVRQATLRLRSLPNSGRPRDDLIPGIRSILVQPYIVFYRVTDQSVDIVSVLHGRRDLEVIFKEKR